LRRIVIWCFSSFRCSRLYNNSRTGIFIRYFPFLWTKSLSLFSLSLSFPSVGFYSLPLIFILYLELLPFYFLASISCKRSTSLSSSISSRNPIVSLRHTFSFIKLGVLTIFHFISTRCSLQTALMHVAQRIYPLSLVFEICSYPCF